MNALIKIGVENAVDTFRTSARLGANIAVAVRQISPELPQKE